MHIYIYIYIYIYICVCVCVCVCVRVCVYACNIFNISPNFCLKFLLSFNVELLKSQNFANSSIILRKRILFLHNKSGGYVKPSFAHVLFSNVFSLSLVLLLE
jgi:hypothetical protein